MQAYVTYDVSNRGNAEVKNGMKAKGYKDTWTSQSIKYHLPNTSLWKDETTLSTALQDIKDVVNAVNRNRSWNDQVKLERCIVVPADPWAGIPGEPF